jgi:hypothetical protein
MVVEINPAAWMNGKGLEGVKGCLDDIVARLGWKEPHIASDKALIDRSYRLSSRYR